MTKGDILEFRGEYRWLSNFWPSEVVLDGVPYPTVEHAYQAAKFPKTKRGPFTVGTPSDAKRLGRTLKPKSNWEKIKVDVMRSLIQQKFARGTKLSEMLKATKERKLVEGNYWGDLFWGVCRGKGENMLGKLLMDQRKFLQEI